MTFHLSFYTICSIFDIKVSKLKFVIVIIDIEFTCIIIWNCCFVVIHSVHLPRCVWRPLAIKI